MVVEWKRYAKSVVNLVMLLLLLLVVYASFSATHAEADEWKVQLGSAAQDITDEDVFEALNNYRGIGYLGNLFLGGERTFQLVIVFVVGFSALFGSNVYDMLHTGMGNLIMTREKYKTFLRKVICAQAIYMTVFIFSFSMIITALTLAAAPQDWSYETVSVMTFHFQSLGAFIRLLILQISLITLFVVPLVCLSSVTPLFISNRILNTAVPLGFIVISFITANTVSGFFPFFADAVQVFDLQQYLLALYFHNQAMLNGRMDGSLWQTFGGALLPVGTIVVAFMTTAFLNVRRFSRDYLQ